MKFILPAIGTATALSLLAFSALQISAEAVGPPDHTETFQKLELFADVMARVRNDYVVDVDDGELIENAINGMLQSLDPHSGYISPENFKDQQVSMSGEYGGLGMEVTMENGVVKVVSPIDETPAKRAGIESGDYITEINGESIIGIGLSEAVDRMRGKPGDPISITVIRGNEDPMEITMTREVIERIPVRHDVRDGVGYLRISHFNEKTGKSLKEAVKALKAEMGGRIPGVVLDLRGNPGGLLEQSIKVSSAFLDGGEVVSTRGRETGDTQRYNAQKGELLRNIPVVILIDGASASASEIVAGALQDRGRALVLGLTSFGKGSVQSIIPLRGGRDGALRLTVQRYYTPAGRSIQATGIVPDIAVAAKPDNGKGNKTLRESDLPNSIINALEDMEAGDGDESISIDYPPEGYDEEGDYQLEKAIEILKNGSYRTQLLAAGK
ncbi:MAG: S41 family peptidase [Hyphomonadaceae bacterium]|nr:S41 family peptidase [Hyphomonadaceae bacterium]MBC6412919.1 S41 family peptidase [Hyphomonadaceae bacterium]